MTPEERRNNGEVGCQHNGTNPTSVRLTVPKSTSHERSCHGRRDSHVTRARARLAGHVYPFSRGFSTDSLALSHWISPSLTGAAVLRAGLGLDTVDTT